MNESSLSYLDAFNAKHLSPSDVAKDFVAPAQFFQMQGLNHCVLIGPRGSGKTTLLKMLLLDAQSSERLVNKTENTKIDFIGIFVPADVRWAKQLEAHVSGIESLETKHRLYELAFGTSVLLAFLDTLETCIETARDAPPDGKKFYFPLQRADEANLARRLADLWATDIKIPSLSELKHQLRIRQTRFPLLASHLKSGVSLHQLSLDDPFISLGWLDAVVTALETVNEFTQKPTQRWALLLDELEIVPPSLLQSIVNCLRSTSSNLIFKLALSPSGSNVFSRMQGSAPTQGNDFKILNLWYNERDDLRHFATQLICQALRKRGMSDLTPDLLPIALGKSSIFEVDGDEEGSIRNKDRLEQMFRELAEKDASFDEFCTRADLDLAQLDTSDSHRNGPLIRKIAPLVQFRNKIIKGWNKDKTVLRGGRASPDAYFGYPNILDLTEGNPRWVLNLADQLDAEHRTKGFPISAVRVQTSAIRSMHMRYAAMLKIYPVSSAAKGKGSTLYGFLETLANSIRKRLYHDAFTPDPSQSFEIDSAAATEFGDLLETAIHLGALVIMNPDSSKRHLESPESIGLIGARVRICYRLAPEFFLPLRSTGQTKLSSALNAGGLLPSSGYTVAVNSPETSKSTAKKLPVQSSLF